VRLHQRRRRGPGLTEAPGTGAAADGPARSDLVLLHGLGSDHRFWDNIRPTLDRFHRTWAPDLPGHGDQARRLSPAQAHPRELAAEVAERLGAAGVGRPHLVGLSLGGWVALELAASGFAASVTALAPAGLWPDGSPGRLERMTAVARALLSSAERPTVALARFDLVRRLGLHGLVVHPERVDAAAFADATKALLRAHSYGACDRAMVGSAFRDGPHIGVPTTVAFGDADRVLPAPGCQWRARAPTEARWVRVPSCGHAMTWDQPETCLALIAETVARAEGALSPRTRPGRAGDQPR
jgi:pimeloyl-ACP methyl ester carboxylesterase